MKLERRAGFLGKKSLTGQQDPKSPQSGPKIGGFDKNLIHSCGLFVLEYESTNGPRTFCKNCMSKKSAVLELWFKNL